MLSTPDDADEGVADDDAGASGADVPDGDGSDGRSETATEGARSGGDDRREVVVPMRLYKTVTVFSTLIAVVCVVLGFVFLDAATFQWIFLRQVVTGLLSFLGVAVPQEVVSTALAFAGLAVIVFGSGVYVLGSRFRAHGMGNSQEDSNEDTDNG